MSLDLTFYMDLDVGAADGTLHRVEFGSRNITHNLTNMAEEAGVYDCLWRPEENFFEEAGQMIAPLTHGLFKLKSNPEYYRRFNPKNGWGDYTGLIEFVEWSLEMCSQYPKASVYACR